MPISRYGWKHDRPDDRDHRFALARPRPATLPPAASAQQFEPPIWHQGELSSCTGHGTCRIVQMARARAGLPDFQLSRLMAYYLGREREGTVTEDIGAEIRDVIKGLARSGVCAETDWPYDASRFAVAPPSDVWTSALADCIKAYSRLNNQDLDELKSCIAGGDGFVFGFEVPHSFEEDAIASTGIFVPPAVGETSVASHCVAAVAYDDSVRPAPWVASGGFLIANSWGTAWGLPRAPGHFWMPYSFITGGACSDFWHATAIGYGPSSQPQP